MRLPSSAAALRVKVRPEHRVGTDEPVGDQPHHPRGHRLGLARPGAGDDDGRRERRLDDRRLLGVGVGSPSSSLSSIAEIALVAHAVTCRPLGVQRAALLQVAVAAVAC